MTCALQRIHGGTEGCFIVQGRARRHERKSLRLLIVAYSQPIAGSQAIAMSFIRDLRLRRESWSVR